MTYWEAFRHYRCSVCRENCINRYDESATKAGECRSCHSVPALDDNPTDSEDPQRMAPSHGGRSEDPQRTARRRRANLDAVRSRGGGADDESQQADPLAF